MRFGLDADEEVAQECDLTLSGAVFRLTPCREPVIACSSTIAGSQVIFVAKRWEKRASVGM